MTKAFQVLASKYFYLFIFLCISAASLHAQKYLAAGPGFGYYNSPDTDSKMNDVIKVRGKFRHNIFGFEASIGYKNEMYDNETVWVRSWPVQASAFLYPLSFLYLGGGAGLYDIYIDYNQSIPELALYENESKKNIGTHFILGVERRLSRTSLLSLEISKSWIDYKFRKLPGGLELDANSLAVEATLLFQLGVGEEE